MVENYKITDVIEYRIGDKGIFLSGERSGIKKERKRIIDHLNKKNRGRTHSAAMRCFYCELILWLEGQGK